MFKINKTTLAITAALLTTTASAEQIEEIEIIGSQNDFIISDPHRASSLLEELLPTQAFTQGGAGGFAGFSERGTKSNHTVVYRNGVPVNDAGAGWYDFGHDIATGNEGIRVVSGPQGALYGTASMGGSVFINDNIQKGSVLAKLGADSTIISASPFDFLNYTYSNIDNGSVRSDNTETDSYTNKTARVQTGDLGFGFVANYAFTDYEYDYDNCSTADWSSSNDCVQLGEKQTLSIRNDNFTFGYNSNKAEYFTNADYLSYESDAQNYYFDARRVIDVSDSLSVLAGVTGTREEYIDKSQNRAETYALVKYQDWIDVGVRYTGDATVSRVGVDVSGVTITASTSYRNPNLYELNGDGAWVFENQDLEPEEGAGVEIGYAGFTVFKYNFTQGIDFDFSTSTYVNTGEYDTKGARFSDTYTVLGGNLGVYAGYTDTEQAGVPEYKATVSYSRVFGNFTTSAKYTTQQNRGVDWAGTVFEDVETVDLFVEYDYSSRIDITLSAEDLLDNEFQVSPGYNAGGRKINLTITYR